MSKSSALTARQQFWVKHIQAARQSKQTLAAYCTAHGLPTGALYEAKSRLQRQGKLAAPSTPVQFARVPAAVVAAAPASAPALCRIHLRNGVTVESAGTPLSAVLLAAAQLP